MSRRVASSAARLFALAWIVNFGWEMAQAPLYAPMGSFWTGSAKCLRASVADAGIVTVLWALGAYSFESPDWFRRASPALVTTVAMIGGVIGIGIEHAALIAGRWAYGSMMPVIPGLGVGVAPVLQMALLPPLVMRLAGSRGARTRHDGRRC